MTNKHEAMSDGETMTRVLTDTLEAIKDGRVEWVAISTRYMNGSTLAVHSAGAPKRPRGCS